MLIDSLLPGGLSLDESYSSVMEGLYTPVGFLYIVLIGPIFEELIFRGAIFGALRRYGNNFAILFSSLLFGFYHMLILQIPFAFVIGLLLGYVASRWSLRASIVLHIIVNGLSCLLSLPESEAMLGLVGFAMLACAVATAVMALRWRHTLGARIRGGGAYYQNTYAYGFSSIAFWIFVVLMTGMGLLQMWFFSQT
jgi:membrane protease YdiL (CAAX protease family)